MWCYHCDYVYAVYGESDVSVARLVKLGDCQHCICLDLRLMVVLLERYREDKINIVMF